MMLFSETLSFSSTTSTFPYKRKQFFRPAWYLALPRIDSWYSADKIYQKVCHTHKQ